MKNRNSEIDITKGILTIGMILAHVINIFYNRRFPTLVLLKHLSVDLVAFSGFFFCFGYALWIAYYQNSQIPWGKVIKTALKCYFAFVISGVAWRIIAFSENVGYKVFADVILVRDLPLYSEFLISFAIITIAGALFYKQITIITQRWQYLILSSAICLVFTFLPMARQQNDPLISVFIGGGKFFDFPVIQYLPLFLLGIYAARNPHWFNVRSYLISLSLVGGLWMASFYFQTPPKQHPPSFLWVISSIGAVMLVRAFANLVQLKFPKLIARYLNAVGQNVLAYVLLSNFCLLLGITLGLQRTLNELQLSIFFTSILVFIFFIQSISIDLNRANQYMDKQG